MRLGFSDFLKGMAYLGLIVGSFMLGIFTHNRGCVTPMGNIASINGQAVEVVDFMYKYINEEGQEVRGDYSLVLQNGYEYTEDGTYSNEYENAEIKIGE